MSITLTALQKQRRDTAANWTTANPTLLAGEIGLESDTGYWKVGDGSTAWTSLAYVPGLGAEIPVSRLADGTARQLLQTAANGTDVEWTSNIDVPGTLDVTGVATFDNNVIVQGDLTVNGTTTTIDTANLVVEDKNIEIGKVATPTDVTADGGGITLKGTTDKTITWVDATDAWTFSEHVNIASGKEYRIAGAKVLDATSLGSGVVSSSLTSVGTIGTGTWQGTAINKTYLDSTLVSTGDTGTVTSTMIANGTIVNADINASAAIAGTKISPDFGSQNTTTTGTSTAASFIPTSSTAPSNGIYLPAANSVAISTNGTGRLFVNSSGSVGVGTSSPGARLESYHSSTNPSLSSSSGAGLSVNGTSTVRLNIGTLPGSPYSSWLQASDGAGTAYPIALNPSGGSVGIGSASPGRALEIGTTGPAIKFNNGTNAWTIGTGAFVDGTDSFLIFEEGVGERLRVDNSGRLLVGTSTSRAGTYGDNTRLLVEGTDYQGGAGTFVVNSNDGNAPSINFGKSRGTGVNSFTVVQSGDSVGVIDFAGADGTNLRSAARIQAFVDATPGTNDMPGRLVFSSAKDGQSSPTEACRIDSSQRLLVGTTTPRGRITSEPAAGDWGLGINDINAGTQSFTSFRYSGTLIGSITGNNTATAYNTSSDYRLKENVTPVTDGITRLQQLKPSRFNFIADPGKTVDGFIAHEVQTVVPEAITGEKDAVDDDGNPIYQGIDQSKLVPLLTAALQEAVARIETLEAKVAALESA